MLTIVESPFAGLVERNKEYARLCLADCFKRGEYPFASHLLYTQPGVLDDNIPEQRRLGIDAGFKWGEWADVIAFYTDLGMSPGMTAAHNHWLEAAIFGDIEMRTLPAEIMQEFFLKWGDP